MTAFYIANLSTNPLPDRRQDVIEVNLMTITSTGAAQVLQCQLEDSVSAFFTVYLLLFVAEVARFELTSPFGLPLFKSGGINHSPTPPYI